MTSTAAMLTALDRIMLGQGGREVFEIRPSDYPPEIGEMLKTSSFGVMEEPGQRTKKRDPAARRKAQRVRKARKANRKKKK